MNSEGVPTAWLDGALCSEDEARPAAWSPTFHYGYGVFEGVRVYPTSNGPAAFRLVDHVRRLRSSAAAYPPLDTVPWSEQELVDAVIAVVQANEFESCYVRPVIDLASGSVGNDPTSATARTLVLATDWPGLLPARGLRLGVSSWRRCGPAALPRSAKANGGYISLMLAKGEAVRNGFDDALILDEAGYVVEATGANLFLRLDNTLVSPGAPQGALAGITRATVCELAAGLDYTVLTASIDLADVYRADEAFITGTGAEIRAVTSVSGRPIGTGKPGRATERLSETYSRVVRGLDPAHLDWLTVCKPANP